MFSFQDTIDRVVELTRLCDFFDYKARLRSLCNRGGPKWTRTIDLTIISRVL